MKLKFDRNAFNKRNCTVSAKKCSFFSDMVHFSRKILQENECDKGKKHSIAPE